MATLIATHNDAPGVVEALTSILRDNGATDIAVTDGQVVAVFDSQGAADAVAAPLRHADSIDAITVEP